MGADSSYLAAVNVQPVVGDNDGVIQSIAERLSTWWKTETCKQN